MKSVACNQPFVFGPSKSYISKQLVELLIVSNCPLCKEARTIEINRDHKVKLIHHILQDVLDVSVQHVRRIPRH